MQQNATPGNALGAIARASRVDGVSASTNGLSLIGTSGRWYFGCVFCANFSHFLILGSSGNRVGDSGAF